MAENKGKAEKGEKKERKPRVVDPAREAQKAKRLETLKELSKKNPTKFHARINFREARELKVNGPDGKPIENWKGFCAAKAVWAAEFWKMAAEKPMASEKSIERKKAAFQKLQERMAKYAKELEGLGISLEKQG